MQPVLLIQHLALRWDGNTRSRVSTGAIICSTGSPMYRDGFLVQFFLLIIFVINAISAKSFGERNTGCQLLKLLL